MKSNKNWFVEVFKCLDHNQLAGLRICMSKDIDLTNSLLSAVHFAPLDGWGKVFKKLDFWFINTWDNINQLQRSRTCIRMLDVGIWVGRIWPQILLEGDNSLSLSVSLSLYKREPWLLPEGSEHEFFSLKFNATTFKYRSTPLKLIYII